LENQYPIHLLITDVVMPGMDGPSLVNQAYEFKPDIKVIFVSGYPQEDVEAQIKCPIKDLHFLPKPFSLNELALKVHEVLRKEEFVPSKQRLAKNG
ncbi:MAG: response regulator, partial [Alphaproteobacteria bacterium]